MSKRIHVVPHGPGWAMRREGASPAGSTHHIQAEATDVVRNTALREYGEVVIHRPKLSYPGRQLVRQRPLPAERITRRAAAFSRPVCAAIS